MVDLHLHQMPEHEVGEVCGWWVRRLRHRLLIWRPEQGLGLDALGTGSFLWTFGGDWLMVLLDGGRVRVAPRPFPENPKVQRSFKPHTDCWGHLKYVLSYQELELKDPLLERVWTFYAGGWKLSDRGQVVLAPKLPVRGVAAQAVGDKSAAHTVADKAAVEAVAGPVAAGPVAGPVADETAAAEAEGSPGPWTYLGLELNHLEVQCLDLLKQHRCLTQSALGKRMGSKRTRNIMQHLIERLAQAGHPLIDDDGDGPEGQVYRYRG